MEIKIRDYQITDCPAILDIINDAILHSTALYDYNVRTLATQEAIFEEKSIYSNSKDYFAMKNKEKN